MKQLALTILISLTVAACGKNAPPPTDSAGQTPEQVVMKAYEFMFSGDFEGAKALFDERLIKAIFPPTHPQGFTGHYQEQIEPWTLANLKTKIIGNNYNDDVWRVRIWSEDGKGAENPAGAQHDLAIINGRWLLVNWSDFPKS